MSSIAKAASLSSSSDMGLIFNVSARPTEYRKLKTYQNLSKVMQFKLLILILYKIILYGTYGYPSFRQFHLQFKNYNRLLPIKFLYLIGNNGNRVTISSLLLCSFSNRLQKYDLFNICYIYLLSPYLVWLLHNLLQYVCLISFYYKIFALLFYLYCMD